ncbi:ABC transporter ATP-binding protein [Dysosmobacter welbionis]|uniref:ABC transporter ATP-binding protein n=1 Tax=Dysosmobacter welbionis TaxID=2093857 RepID=UPI003A8FD8EB
MIKLMKRILAVSGKYKRRIQLAFVFSFLKSLLAKAPIMLAFLALAGFYEGTLAAVDCLWYGIAMAACVLLQVVFHHIADRLQSAAGFMVFSDMRMELGAHLRRMPMGYFTEGNIGKISSVLSSDMVFIEENCMTVLADMMSYIFAEAIMVIFLLFFNLWIGLAALVIIGIILLIARSMKKEALQDSKDRQEQNENLTEAVLDFVEGIGIIKTYNLLGEKSKELTENFEKSCETNIRFEENHSPYQLWMNIVYGLGVAAIVALSFFLNSQALLGVTFLVGIMLFVSDLFGPIKALYTQATRLTVMNSCMDRIEEVFGEKELPDNGKTSIPENSEAPEVEFRNVRFAYGEKDVLHSISFTLPQHTMAALVGPSGGGKSTVANLLARFWDVGSGKVLVRGKDVRDVRLADLMDHISMVFQRVYLFQDTIYNNIAMGRPDAAREEVMEAAKKARCYDFIMALPNGFDTVIGEGGESLSGGERQRISIARCILKDAPIVILDEATASVDADNESYIQQAISELCKGKTLLVIAHRLNTIRNADQILVIADGRIAQAGTHKELMEAGGLYRDFVTVRQQSQGWNRRVNA